MLTLMLGGPGEEGPLPSAAAAAAAAAAPLLPPFLPALDAGAADAADAVAVARAAVLLRIPIALRCYAACLALPLTPSAIRAWNPHQFIMPNSMVKLTQLV
jgi:hypothetical protein